METLNDYFENKKGLGVLSTANAQGWVDAAIYSRPHVIDEHSVAFIMLDRLSHNNLQTNPHAAYLFVEQAEGYKGKRLYLTKIREEKDLALIESMRRHRQPQSVANKETDEFLVYFRINKIRPLVGD